MGQRRCMAAIVNATTTPGCCARRWPVCCYVVGQLVADPDYGDFNSTRSRRPRNVVKQDLSDLQSLIFLFFIHLFLLFTEYNHV